MKKTIDVLLLGATGFTGRFVAKYLNEFCPSITWAIAGRNVEKMSSLVTNLQTSTGTSPKVILADVSNSESLISAFSEARIVVNCTGPYRFLGNSIIEACLMTNSDYMDICGEPQFMEASFLNYHEIAKNKNVNIIHSCAFDSVPADLGVLRCMQEFEVGCCHAVESFFDLNAPKGFSAHKTTFDCAVHGFGDAGSVRQIRKEIDLKFKVPKPIRGPPLPTNRDSHFLETRLGMQAVPFMGADVSVVRSSQRLLTLMTGQRTWPHFAHFATVDNLDRILRYRNTFVALASHPIGRSLLLQFPSLFSGGVFTSKGPTDEQLAATTFNFHLFATGSSPIIGNPSTTSSNKLVQFVLRGPEPFYVATPRLLVPLIETVLDERETLPQGGVYTPAAAFYNCPSVFKRLAAAGMSFEKVSR